MPICLACNEEVPYGIDYCPHCGAELNWLSPKLAVAPPPPETEWATQLTSGLARWQSPLFLIAGILLTACVLCCGLSVATTAFDSQLRAIGFLPPRTPTPEPPVTPEPTPTLTDTPLPTGTPAPPPPADTPTPELTNTPLPADTPAPVTAGRETARVTQVVDGDTIKVEIGGRIHEVRYIRIDTPEIGEPFYAEATEANRRLVEGQVVELEKDVSETDKYGRLLRYVYVSGVMVNAELVRQGYARAQAYPPDTRYQDQLAALQREAREAGRGLWAAGPAAVPTATAAPAPGGDCDPAYPDVCIPPPPPDLDCDDIPHRNFKVLPPDPHRFDGRDNDGIGCEQ